MASGNFFTWNPLVKGTENISSGNCKLDMTTNNRGALGNFEIPLTGKWYFEGYIKMASGLEGVIGVSDAEVDLQSNRGGKNDSNTEALNFSQYSGSNYFAIKIDGGSEDAGGRIDLGSTDNVVIGVAVNRDDNELKIYANNTLRFTLTLSATTKYFPWCGVGGGANSSAFVYLNAGQDSTFGGNKTAGGNADGNGFGDFFYSPPSDHIALSSANLPISADIDPAQTDDDYPSKQFNVVTYTGNGSTINVTGVGFQPDFVWLKMRSPHAYNHMMFDTNRGVTKHISSDRNNSEFTTSNSLTSFDSDGFTYGSELSGNDSGDSFVGYCWRANGGVTTTDTSGDISTVRQSNPKGGFAILTWTGNGSSSQRLPHGLGKRPTLVFAKRRDAAQSWGVWSTFLGANSKELQLDSNSAWESGAAWYESGMTTDFIGMNSSRNISGGTNVAYVWTDIEGYSKCGSSYNGNADADGAFVYTGFRPRMIILRAVNVASDGWLMYDTARETFNVMDSVLKPHDTATEYSNSAFRLDVLSNGFKLRSSDNAVNGTSYDPYIYMAWGDVPFKYNNTR